MVNTFAWVFGIVLVLVGVLGYVPGVVNDGGMLLGIFEVDTMHNIIHLATGVLAILAVMMGYARRYFQVFGVVYALVAVVGFVQGDTVLGLIGVNMADNVLHVVIAAAALWVGFGMKEQSAMAGMPSQPSMPQGSM